MKSLVDKFPRRANFVERSHVRALRQEVSDYYKKDHDYIWKAEGFAQKPTSAGAIWFKEHVASVGDDEEAPPVVSE